MLYNLRVVDGGSWVVGGGGGVVDSGGNLHHWSNLEGEIEFYSFKMLSCWQEFSVGQISHTELRLMNLI